MGLGGLGVTHAEQEVYELLLGHSDVTLARLAELSGTGKIRLGGLLDSLEDHGMLTRTEEKPVRFTAAPPDIAVEILAARRQEEIARARLAGIVLGNRFRVESDSPIQLVRGREAVAHQFHQIRQLAKQEVLILDKPPYVVEPDGSQLVLQRESQAKGVRYRTIYDRAALDEAGQLDELKQLTASGEQARVLTGVPMKLVIADHRFGLVPYEPPAGHQSVLLRSSALLDGLVTLFESLWERATPLWPQARHPGSEESLTTDDQQLLALLAAGLTDAAIARKLGVAKRTVERRIRRVMDGLGAQTRFQAGLQAATHGLFDVPES
jgi:DNA-binding CsgD family transcriptional regulator